MEALRVGECRQGHKDEEGKKERMRERKRRGKLKLFRLDEGLREHPNRSRLHRGDRVSQEIEVRLRGRWTELISLISPTLRENAASSKGFCI